MDCRRNNHANEQSQHWWEWVLDWDENKGLKFGFKAYWENRCWLSTEISCEWNARLDRDSLLYFTFDVA